MDNEKLLNEIAAVNSEIVQAAEALQGLLRDLDVAPRAEKTTVSGVVRDAFERLRIARARLAQLQELMAAEPPAM